MVLRANDISLGWYEFFSFIFPLAGLIVDVAMILSTVVAFYIAFPLLFKEDNDDWRDEPNLLARCLIGLEKFCHYAVREIFGMKPSPRDTPMSPKTEIFGFYVVPGNFLIQVILMAVYLVWFAVCAFIYTLFVKESHECVANNRDLACFTVNAQ